MSISKPWGRLALVLLLLWAGGCSGVLMENKLDDGRVDRLVIDGGEGWDSYDTRSRFPQTRTRDEYSILLKKEATF